MNIVIMSNWQKLKIIALGITNNNYMLLAINAKIHIGENMFLETIDKLKVVPYERKIKPWYFYDTTYMMVLDKYITKEDHPDL